MDNSANVATRFSFIHYILMIFTQCAVLRKMTLGKSHDKLVDVKFPLLVIKVQTKSLINKYTKLA